MPARLREFDGSTAIDIGCALLHAARAQPPKD